MALPTPEGPERTIKSPFLFNFMLTLPFLLNFVKLLNNISCASIILKIKIKIKSGFD
ncbi:hypothetical protein PAWBP_2020 [Paulownia witches'-broom phytoplasma]|nr:hypothetical protein PAWBP_2020 [Paulownia witches'-broom phytoplasma]